MCIDVTIVFNMYTCISIEPIFFFIVANILNIVHELICMYLLHRMDDCHFVFVFVFMSYAELLSKFGAISFQEYIS